MRIYLIWLFIVFISIYSWKDWYKGTCVLILLMAIFERPDMPKEVFGIPGLNPWNMLFLNVVGSYIYAQSKLVDKFHVPVYIKVFLYYYCFFIVLAFVRKIADFSGIVEYASYFGYEPLSKFGMAIEDVVNPIKYAVPGILLLVGCNSKERATLAAFSLTLMYLLIAIQIIKVMPLPLLTDGRALEQRAIRVINRDVGYYRSDAAIFLAGGAWAIYAVNQLFKNNFFRIYSLMGTALIALSIALTGGRIGQGTFMLLGLILGWFRWKHLLVLAPVCLMLLVLLIPSVKDRFTQGFEYDPDDVHMSNAETEKEGQLSSMTSGRTVIWPYVAEKIMEAPLFGYGRHAMQRTGLSLYLAIELNEVFPHPHNAYLQLFLDNGFILALPVLLFHLIVLKKSFRLLREKDDKLAITLGILGFTSVSSFLLGAIAQQSFYPVASSLGMIASMGLALRAYHEKYNNNLESLSTSCSPTWNTEKDTTANTTKVKRPAYY